MESLQQFEAVEANIAKSERVWAEIRNMVPDGIVYGNSLEYEDKTKILQELVGSLPAIEKWRPCIEVMALNDIASNRFQIDDLLFGDIDARVSLDDQIDQPGRELREYRYLFNKQRRSLIRKALSELIKSLDKEVQKLEEDLLNEIPGSVPALILTPALMPQNVKDIKALLAQVDTLLGSSVPKPARWGDMHRHLSFAEEHDFHDIINIDWPLMRKDLEEVVFDSNEPLPVQVTDLSDLTRISPDGPVRSGLAWENLSDDTFERLIFALITETVGYENPRWLTNTNAPDKGRDLSVERVLEDPLMGVLRHRTIIQCKHWLTKSVSIADVSVLKEQMKLWEPPRIDTVIIATSGRFTTDAVQSIEGHNLSDSGLRIEMWPETHLETLLAARPSLIAQFGLR